MKEHLKILKGLQKGIFNKRGYKNQLYVFLVTNMIQVRCDTSHLTGTKKQAEKKQTASDWKTGIGWLHKWKYFLTNRGTLTYRDRSIAQIKPKMNKITGFTNLKKLSTCNKKIIFLNNILPSTDYIVITGEYNIRYPKSTGIQFCNYSTTYFKNP